MLKNIKSSYILKIIVNIVNEKTKLQLIKYSKYLKNKIDIDLLKYKIFSGRYIIYESKSKGNDGSSQLLPGT